MYKPYQHQSMFWLFGSRQLMLTSCISHLVILIIILITIITIFVINIIKGEGLEKHRRKERGGQAIHHLSGEATSFNSNSQVRPQVPLFLPTLFFFHFSLSNFHLRLFLLISLSLCVVSQLFLLHSDVRGRSEHAIHICPSTRSPLTIRGKPVFSKMDELS